MICGCRQQQQQQVLSGSTTTFVAPYIRDELAFLFLVDVSTLIILPTSCLNVYENLFCVGRGFLFVWVETE